MCQRAMMMMMMQCYVYIKGLIAPCNAVPCEPMMRSLLPVFVRHIAPVEYKVRNPHGQ